MVLASARSSCFWRLLSVAVLRTTTWENGWLAAKFTVRLPIGAGLQKLATPSQLERVAQRAEKQVNPCGALHPGGVALVDLPRAREFAQHGATGHPSILGVAW